MEEDEYAVEAHDFTATITFDEDSYCTHADQVLEEFVGLCWRGFSETADRLGWNVEMIPF